MAARFFRELRRRGVLGALTAYGVVAAGGLQLADIVVHNLEMPGWTLRVLIWIAAIGLVATGVISWFYDLTRRGFVRTAGPPHSPRPSPPPLAVSAATPQPARDFAASAAALQAVGPGGLLASGRYRVEKELGAGGMGRVLAATDMRLGRRVAIKLVTGAWEPARVRRFEQEARTAGSLEHPNVLAVYDLGEQDGVPFLVTELLEGHTLRTLLERGKIPHERVHELGLQLARGLAAAHARGVVHRDLKPENLFVTSDGRLKILDFGLAKLVAPSEDGMDSGAQALTMTGALFGTPGYLSPEQARGERAGAPSDIFSAGTVLYEMLSGRRAFPGTSLVEAGHATLTAKPLPLSSSVPEGLEAVIFRCLEKNPARRYADGSQLAAALDAVHLSAPVGAAAQGSRASWRRSTALGVAAAALGIGAALASAFRVRSSDDHRRSQGRVVQRLPPPLAGAQSGDDDAEQKDDEDAVAPGHPGGPGIPIPPAPPAPPAPLVEPEKLDRHLQALQKLLGRSGSGPSVGIARGASALEHANQPDKAEAMLRKWISDHPGDLHAWLHLAGLLRRTGRADQSEKEMKALAKKLPGDEWIQPMIHVYAGDLDDDDAFEVAQSAEDEKTRRSQVCEANFYLGVFHATGDDPDPSRARREFEAAMAQNTNDVERDFAKEELRKLVSAARRR